jgi:microcystin-dependent protein
MLYRSATTNALYISDSVHAKSSPVGGNFTRVGIGNRVENGITALTANIASYEIGELVATPSASGSLSANARLYLISANNGTMADVVDVGIPPTNGSIQNTMLGVGSVDLGRVNFAKVGFSLDSFDGVSDYESNTTLKVSGLAGVNTSIGLGTLNNGNVAVVHRTDAAATSSLNGLHVMKTPGNYANLAAATLSQNSIENDSDSTPAPLLPAGSIIMWTGSSAPSGWLLCDGSNVSRTTYASLFAVSGTAYGTGDGSSTFGLPDLRDRFPLGKGTNNSTLGTETGSTSASSVLTTNADGDGDLTVGTTSVAATAKDSTSTTVVNSVSQASHTHTLTVPSSVVNYIIKT